MHTFSSKVHGECTLWENYAYILFFTQAMFSFTSFSVNFLCVLNILNTIALLSKVESCCHFLLSTLVYRLLQGSLTNPLGACHTALTPMLLNPSDIVVWSDNQLGAHLKSSAWHYSECWSSGSPLRLAGEACLVAHMVNLLSSDLGTIAPTLGFGSGSGWHLAPWFSCGIGLLPLIQPWCQLWPLLSLPSCIPIRTPARIQ